MHTRRPDFRFSSLGNSLGCLLGLLAHRLQERSLFRLVLHNRTEPCPAGAAVGCGTARHRHIGG
jgi:hypothetical protein